MTETYTVIGLYFWDYRHPTGATFGTFEEAKSHADALNAQNFDPLYCYMVTKLDPAPPAPGGAA